MLKFFRNYEKFIYPLILITVFVIYITLTWGKWGFILYDAFREAILPQAILEGKIFYKDILNLYPPLAYQINAGLYFMFGNSLNTLYMAGIVNSFLILSILYFMVQKFSSRLIAFVITLSVMEIFTFRAPCMISSWFFPYSYSFIYGFLAAILGFLFYILYKENKGLINLFLSLLFFGLSVALKLDFILCGLLPLVEVVKGKSLKTLFKGIFCFLAPIILSFLIYFIQGGDFGALFYEFNFLINFSKAPSVIEFNKAAMPQSLSPFVLGTVFLSFIRFFAVSLILFSYSYFSVSTLLKIKNIFLKTLLGAAFLGIGLKIIIPVIASKQFAALKVQYDLCFVPYFIAFAAILILVLKFKDFHQDGRVRNVTMTFSMKEKFFLISFVFGLLISFRTFALVHLSSVGNFLSVIWWMCFVYFFVELMPGYFPKMFENKKLKAALIIFFMTFGLYFTHIYTFNANNMKLKVKSDKGEVYAFREEVFAINEGIKFINENIRPDETLLVMDEGLIFNYLTDRKTNLKYYALIPHMTDTYGEDKIINDLKKNPPDYIFVLNRSYGGGGGYVFGINYAKNIYQFVLNNYKYIKTIENKKGSEDPEDIKFEIYRAKK